MTPDISMFSLFVNASFLVKLVMLLLLVASIYSWTLIFQQAVLLRNRERTANKFQDMFWAGTDLHTLYNKIKSKKNRMSGLQAIFAAGFEEYLRLKETKDISKEMMTENIQRAMRVATIQQEKELSSSLPMLATIQSMSPYIGLFGTVWGIMHAFRQLGTAQQATIAMVAPGISEALIATAMGLIAAIPAGIAYNRYLNNSDSISMQYRGFIEEFICIIQRRLYVE